MALAHYRTRLSRGGFLHKTAAATLLCTLAGVLLISPGMSSENSPQTNNLPTYSDWQTAQNAQNIAYEEDPFDNITPDDIKVGSFHLTRPQSELFIGGLSKQLGNSLLELAVQEDDIENHLRARARAGITGGDAPDFRDWLLSRGDGIQERLLRRSADYVTGYLTAAAGERAGGLSFIETVEWDLQSTLGNRRWSSGLSALGALRETPDGVIAWQLRAYAADEGGRGGNAGIIYRRAVDLGGGGLIGVNSFFDYEAHGTSDENFWRWSLGGEYRNAKIDIHLNRYFPLTESDSPTDQYYTQGGFDAQLNINAPDFIKKYGAAAGGFTYYRWDGEHGNADDEGLRYHLRFSPVRGRVKLQMELESPDGGNVKWGGRISYRHVLGAPRNDGSSSASGSAAFDARAHFFNSVQREYTQRIRKKPKPPARFSAIDTEPKALVQTRSAASVLNPLMVLSVAFINKAEGGTTSYEYTFNPSESIHDFETAIITVAAAVGVRESEFVVISLVSDIEDEMTVSIIIKATDTGGNIETTLTVIAQVEFIDVPEVPLVVNAPARVANLAVYEPGNVLFTVAASGDLGKNYVYEIVGTEPTVAIVQVTVMPNPVNPAEGIVRVARNFPDPTSARISVRASSGSRESRVVAVALGWQKRVYPDVDPDKELVLMGSYGGNADRGTSNGQVLAAKPGSAWVTLTFRIRDGANNVSDMAEGGAATLNNRIYVTHTGGRNDTNGKNVFYSEDGESWTHSEDVIRDARSGHGMVSFRGNLYVIGGWFSGSTPSVERSADGATWTPVTDASPTGRHGAALVVHDDGNGDGDKIYMIGGSTGGNGFNDFGAAVTNDVWVSPDGSSWDKLAVTGGLPSFYLHQAVSFRGKIYIVGGGGNPRGTELARHYHPRDEVWSSPDGRHWTQVQATAAFGNVYGHEVLVQGDKMYLMGGVNIPEATITINSRAGNYNLSGEEIDNETEANPKGNTSVWSSSDGINWTSEVNMELPLVTLARDDIRGRHYLDQGVVFDIDQFD